jgi:hypothetical protein
MKKLILIMFLVAVGTTTFGQGVWSQFGKRTKGSPVALFKEEGDKTLKWFIQPTAQLTAMNLNYDSETKLLEATPFSAAGIGVGIQNYVEHNGVLVNNVGFNVLIMVNGSSAVDKAGFGLAGTVNALGFVNVGGGRDFTNKVWLMLIGGSWNF